MASLLTCDSIVGALAAQRWALWIFPGPPPAEGRLGAYCQHAACPYSEAAAARRAPFAHGMSPSDEAA